MVHQMLLFCFEALHDYDEEAAHVSRFLERGAKNREGSCAAASGPASTSAVRVLGAALIVLFLVAVLTASVEGAALVSAWLPGGGAYRARAAPWRAGRPRL